tara:strand:+ start:2092 stop:2547 length:456 start_codon:yes stop_codon:yes gene_type:complete
MSDENAKAIGCITAILVVFFALPVYLAAFAYSPLTTIVFTIIAGAIGKYTWQDWKHWFIDSSQTSNNYTRGRNAGITARQEVEVITRMLLGDPDLDCKATKGNKLTIEESVNIHFKRLDKFGRSRRDGEIEYMGPRGGIYIYTAKGNRSYR